MALGLLRLFGFREQSFLFVLRAGYAFNLFSAPEMVVSLQ